MPDDKKKKGAGRPPPAPPPSADDENDRPTVNPPFDVEAYARQAGKPSASGGPGAPPPPAVPSFEPEETRSRQITLTNEVELEKAREMSAVRTDPPPPRHATPSALSMADARAPSAPNHPAVVPGPRSPTPASIEAAVLGAIGSSPAPEITERTIEDPVAEMRERFSLGDYTGALEMAELILAEEPGNLEAAECGENCRTVLENMFAARLGPLDRVPMVVVPRTQMRWLSIDHRAGFVLSLIDGSSSVEMILDVCGMPRLDALRILHELVQQKIVAFR
ncbi:MAG TPA: hypothetical protein VMI75_03475 [Polyangiaceae bacterium]|nr:hypothetical protein [Polyangiaceae bacterium]